jgi:hypothetical protein
MTMPDSVDGYMGVDTMQLQDMQRQQMQHLQNLAQYQLNFDDNIKLLREVLSGLREDEDGNFSKVGEPLMNTIGQNHIMLKVRFWLLKIQAQSNWDEARIMDWCRVFWKELCVDGHAYGTIWELKDYQYDFFVHHLVHLLEATMRAAKDGGLREIVGKMSKVVETSYVNAPQQKKLINL